MSEPSLRNPPNTSHPDPCGITTSQELRAYPCPATGSMCPVVLKSPRSSYYYYPHFTDGETEGCPKSHDRNRAGPRHECRSARCHTPSRANLRSLSPLPGGRTSGFCSWPEGSSSSPTLLQVLLNALICKYKGFSEARH